MSYAPDGSIVVTVVDGLSFVGAFAADGSINVIEASGFGAYHPCGALRVTTVDGSAVTGLYAADGSMNATNADSDGETGLYHPCGAIRMLGLFSVLALAPFSWYDPSDLNTLFQDSAMTTPVTADNDPVGAVLDKSGNDHHLTQATDLSRPLYKTVDGVSWLEFDGSDDSLLSDALVLAQPHDRVVAFRQVTWVSGRDLWGGLNGGAGNASRLLMDNGGGAASPDVLAFSGSATVALTDEAEGIDQVITERWSGASSRFATDNNSYATGNPGTTAANGVVIGAFANATSNSNIRVHQFIEFDRAITDDEIASLRTFSALKQGRVL